ncbi:hypothetical protein EMCRGX_G005882 [Ephydatia muelleri]
MAEAVRQKDADDEQVPMLVKTDGKLLEESKQRSINVVAVIRFESIIHEFDPWFNYRATHHMAMNGFYPFLNWFDKRAWYPLGRIVGGTVYPGLMVTSGFIHNSAYSCSHP